MIEEEFTEIFRKNSWGSSESVSGPGSSVHACQLIIERIPVWITMLGIRSIVDLGCGDFNWMSMVDLSIVEYDGYDIVGPIIEKNQALYGRQNIRFHHRDISDMQIPRADLIILKDVLIHLPTEIGAHILKNIRESESQWLSATTSPGWEVKSRQGLFMGGFSPTDLSAAPYGLGAFQESVSVPHREDHPEKFLGLWKLANK